MILWYRALECIDTAYFAVDTTSYDKHTNCYRICRGPSSCRQAIKTVRTCELNRSFTSNPKRAERVKVSEVPTEWQDAIGMY